jgi:dihydroflavonol-4-reductase
MIVAVTGATGFVGSNLVRELLLQGHTVRALVHSPEPPPSLSDLALGQQASPPQLTFHRGDILDPGSLQRVFAGSEVVFHLAARISITRHDNEAVLRTNVEGPRNVAAACLESGVRRLVHFSSVHAMHVPPRDEPMDESTPLVADERAPAYDRSKSLGEREILRAVDKGLDAVIITPSGIMGPGDHGPSRIGRTVLDFARGRFPLLVPGVYNWVDVRDVVAGALAAAERGQRGEKYIVAGEVGSVRRIAELIAESGGKRAPRFDAPLWLLRPVAPVVETVSHFTKSSPLVTPQALAVLQSPCDFRYDKAARCLGHRPRPLSETVHDTVEWFRQAGRLS